MNKPLKVPKDMFGDEPKEETPASKQQPTGVDEPCNTDTNFVNSDFERLLSKTYASGSPIWVGVMSFREMLEHSLHKDSSQQPEIDEYRRISTVDFPQRARAEAFRGLAGEITKTICEESELCPEAVLSQFLCIFGNMIGRGPHKEQEGRHGTVINVAIVGNTADGAKGGSLTAVKKVIFAVDEEFHNLKLRKGYNSAEALIEEICDEIEGINKQGEVYTVQEEEPDKRLVITEEELSKIFKIDQRGGSIMSEIMREFYDSPELVAAMSRRAGLMTTRPHVSILGHITPEGLKSSMPSVEAFNGFANRFMYIASRRMGDVPEPAVLNWREGALRERAEYLSSLVRKIRPQPWCKNNPDHVFRFSETGRERWSEIYRELGNRSRGKFGMTGAIVARAKPTVLRLSIIYTALDSRKVIEPHHLDAAFALWDYSCASALWAFGENSGNADADKILRHLRRCGERGASRSDILTNVFGGNAPAARLTEALAHLKAGGLATVEKTGKRETWRTK